MKIRPSILLFVIAIISMAASRAADTNDVFLEIDPAVYSDAKTEAAAVERQINAALASPESRPAEMDPEGHWGDVVSGLQLSIRFFTNAFMPGEPIQAKVILRNMTTNPIVVFGPSYASISLVVNDANNNKFRSPQPLMISGPMRLRLPGHRQISYAINLDRLFDLKPPGTYRVQAKRPLQTTLAKGVSELSSEMAAIKILPSTDNQNQKKP